MVLFLMTLKWRNLSDKLPNQYAPKQHTCQLKRYACKAKNK